jgi:hypothetical protein
LGTCPELGVSPLGTAEGFQYALIPSKTAPIVDHPSRLGCTDASAHGTSRPSIHRNLGVPLFVRLLFKLLVKLAVIGL